MSGSDSRFSALEDDTLAPAGLPLTRPGIGGPSRQQVVEVQRARILAAATDLLEELGHANLTVTAIVQRARISRKTFYEIFGNADQCFEAVVERISEMAATAASAAYERESSWIAGVRAALGSILRMIDEQPGLARIWLVDASAGPAGVVAHRMRAASLMADVVNRGRELVPSSRRPSPLIAEGVVGAVMHIVRARMSHDYEEPVTPLFGSLMYLIALPYLGAARARVELATATVAGQARNAGGPARTGPLGDLKMRLTYRTIRTLSAVADHPGASNRVIAVACGVKDQGQISKLLSRLERLRLLENGGKSEEHGSSNSWTLTARGFELIRETNVHVLR